MPEGQVLEFSGITKRFGAVTAVSDFSARVEPGVVTGFLGPNGAGKTTTLRILLGLVRSTGGTATIGGVPYASLKKPLQAVGAVLEASSFHPGRTAANHLKVYAQAAGLPVSRVEETLGLVGLADVGGRKVGGFSLGMRQRLGLAYALLGDPGVLVLDEPANGLDPEGIKWMRGLLRELAHEGRTVFISSHLLAEVQQTVDSVLIISQGRLVYEGALEDLADPSEFATVVDSPDRRALGAALTQADVSFEVLRSGLTVRGLDAAEVGAIAASAGVALSGLQRRGPALEEVFLDLVSGARVHPKAAPGGLAPVEAAAEPVEAPAEPVEAAAEPVEAPAEPVEAPAEPVEAPAEPVEAPAEPVATEAEAAESAAVAADLDAGSGVTPGAAIATGAGVGAAAWATSEKDDAVDAPDGPVAESPPGPTYAVASTGVIDIVLVPAGNPATDAYQDGLALDPDPDVEALGAIDDELSDGEDEGDGLVGEDRPWEQYVKTEADLEADAFFASFTAAERAEAVAEAERLSAAGQDAVTAPDTPEDPAAEGQDSADEDAQAGHDDEGGEPR